MPEDPVPFSSEPKEEASSKGLGAKLEGDFSSFQMASASQNSLEPVGWPKDPLALPAELQHKALQELGETPQVKAQAIEELRGRLAALPREQQPHRLDDQYLLAFLRPQRFKVDVALRKIAAYTKFKRDHKELLTDMKAEDFREFLKIGMIRPLAPADQEGRRILYVCPPRILDLKEPEMVIKFQVFFFEQTGLLFDPYAQVHGLVVVDQLEGFTLAKAMHLVHGPIKHVPRNSFWFLREAMPFRIKGILMINQPTYMDVIFGVLRPFLSPLLLSRVKLLGKGDKGLFALHKLVLPQYLTPELDGTWSQTTDEWVDQVVALEKKGKTFPVL